MKRLLRPFRMLPALSMLWIGSLHAQRCGGTERWSVKVGTDSRAASVQLLPHIPITLQDLIHLPMPHLPATGDNTTRLKEETHVYELTGRLVKFKHETDDDYHLVVSDATLIFTDDSSGTPPGHSVIAEIPDPQCFAGQHGDPHTPSRFAAAIKSARSELEAQFPNSDTTGAWSDAAGVPVKVVGVGFFDRPHHQVGRAANNIELHPVLDIVFNPTPVGPSAPANGPPTTSVTGPADDASVRGPVTITATASSGVTKLELYVDGAIVACNVNATAISYPWDTGQVANGPHRINSKAYDAVGDVVVSATVTATVAN